MNNEGLCSATQSEIHRRFLQFEVFTFSRSVIYCVMKQCFLSTNFGRVEPFNLDYVINFYMSKNGLGSSVFTLKTRQRIKVLSGNLLRVNEWATMPSVNNVTKWI